MCVPEQKQNNDRLISQTISKMTADLRTAIERTVSAEIKRSVLPSKYSLLVLTQYGMPVPMAVSWAKMGLQLNLKFDFEIIKSNDYVFGGSRKRMLCFLYYFKWEWFGASNHRIVGSIPSSTRVPTVPPGFHCNKGLPLYCRASAIMPIPPLYRRAAIVSVNCQKIHYQHAPDLGSLLNRMGMYPHMYSLKDILSVPSPRLERVVYCCVLITGLNSLLDPVKKDLHNVMAEKLTATDHVLKENLQKLMHSQVWSSRFPCPLPRTVLYTQNFMVSKEGDRYSYWGVALPYQYIAPLSDLHMKSKHFGQRLC